MEAVVSSEPLVNTSNITWHKNQSLLLKWHTLLSECPDYVVQFSSMVRWHTATLHFAASVLNQMNASMAHPLSNCDQEMHLFPFANAGNGQWTATHANTWAVHFTQISWSPRCLIRMQMHLLTRLPSLFQMPYTKCCVCLGTVCTCYTYATSVAVVGTPLPWQLVSATSS